MKTSLRRLTAAMTIVFALLGFGASGLVALATVETQPRYVLVAEDDESSDEDSSDEDEESDEDSDEESDEDQPTYVPTPTPTTPSPTPTPSVTPSASPTPTRTTEAPVVSSDKTVPTSAEATIGGLSVSQIVVFGFLALVAVAAVVDAIRRRNVPAPIADHRVYDHDVVEPAATDPED